MTEVKQERLESITEENNRKLRIRQKAEDDRQAKRELVEDFKFRKEMEKQKNMQIEEFSKRQVTQKT